MRQMRAVAAIVTLFTLQGCCRCLEDVSCEVIGAANTLTDADSIGLSDVVHAYLSLEGDWVAEGTCEGVPVQAVLTIHCAETAEIEVWSAGDPDHTWDGDCPALATTRTDAMLLLGEESVSMELDTRLHAYGEGVWLEMEGDAEGVALGLSAEESDVLVGAVSACDIGLFRRP